MPDIGGLHFKVLCEEQTGSAGATQRPGVRWYSKLSAPHWDRVLSPGRFFWFLKIFIYFWLRWVFIAACGAFSSCGEWGQLFVAVCRLLIAVASLVAEHGF